MKTENTGAPPTPEMTPCEEESGVLDQLICVLV